jgi:hypothetical protein
VVAERVSQWSTPFHVVGVVTRRGLPALAPVLLLGDGVTELDE